MVLYTCKKTKINDKEKKYELLYSKFTYNQ